MGQLLSALREGRRTYEEVFLDFDNCQPSESEKTLWTQINDVLKAGPALLDKLVHYAGCGEAIRKAITSPTPDSERAAWAAVLPCVGQLEEFYNFSLQLKDSFPKLLVALCKDDPRHSLSNQQALAKQLGDVFDFVLRFDDAKMINPAIQNDISYYRRSLSRMKIAKKENGGAEEDRSAMTEEEKQLAELTAKHANPARDELNHHMSLFFAFPTPMMKTLSETTAAFLASAGTEVPRDNVTDALAQMANICCDMVAHSKFPSNDTNMFCLRSMTGAIILYDHVSPLGAFCKKSPINMKACINTLKGYTQSSTCGLLNALRFTTVHLKDAETPAFIKQMLA